MRWSREDGTQRPRPGKGVLLAFGAALAIVGCGGDEGLLTREQVDATEITGARRTARAEERETETAVAFDADGDGFQNDIDACPEEPEDEVPAWNNEDGCPDTIDDLMTLAREDVEAFWVASFEAEELEYSSATGFVQYTTEISTPCGPALLNNAFYCPADHAIYYDLGLMQDLLKTKGDFGPAFVVAHEWGHLVQANLGILQDDSLFTIQIELQADCLAGVWTADADSRGVLDEGDFDEGLATLFSVGDARDTPWFDPGAHGTGGQRIDAYDAGYDLGIDACGDLGSIVPGFATRTPVPTETPVPATATPEE